MIPAEGERRRKYLLKSVLLAGVPPLFAEDAIQDVELRLWRHGRDELIVVRRAAIDAARRYGRRGRGSARPVFVGLETELAQRIAAPVQEPRDTRPVRFRSAIKQLGLQDRAILKASALGHTMTQYARSCGISYSRAAALRRRAIARMQVLA